MRLTVLLISIASAIVSTCGQSSNESKFEDTKIKFTILRGFHQYDSINFDQRHACFFRFFVAKEMDPLRPGHGWKQGNMLIQTRFARYPNFGFAIVGTSTDVFYYGFSDVYKFDNAENLDSVLYYDNAALANLLGACFDKKENLTADADISEFMYHLYFQSRNNYSAPLFVPHKMDKAGLIFSLGVTNNKYKEYVQETLAEKRDELLVIYEIQYSGYLVFQLPRVGVETVVKELFIPHANRPRQLAADNIPDEYAAECVNP